MTWIGLALGASVTGELSDYIAGVSCRTCRVLTILLISQVFGLVLVLPVVATLSHGPPRGDFIVWACLAGVAEAIAFAAFYRAMTTGAISIVAPVTATAAVAPLGVGLASGERLGAVATAGIALALVGVAAVAYEGRAGSAEGGDTRVAPGIGMAVVAAVGFGLFFVPLDRASATDVWWTVFFNRAASVALIGAVAIALRPPLRVGPARTAALAAVGARTSSPTLCSPRRPPPG